MVETTEEYRNRINQLKTGIENEPYIKKMREDIAEGISKTGNRQADIEDQFQEVIDNTTGKDVIAAPELIAARNGEVNLKARLDKEQQQVNAQLAQTMTQEEFNSWIATILDGGPTIFFETLSALKAAYPSGAPGAALIRETDPSHIYVWNGTSWEDFGAYQGLEIQGLKKTNIYDAKQLVVGKFVSSVGISDQAASMYAKLPTSPLKKYYLYRASGNYSVAGDAIIFRKSDSSIISIVKLSDLPNELVLDEFGNEYVAKFFETPSNTAESLVNIKLGTTYDDRGNTVVSEFNQIKNEIYALENHTIMDRKAREMIEETKNEIGEIIKSESRLKTKKWLVLGDSITALTFRSSKNYHDYIAERTGVLVTNKGDSGKGYIKTAVKTVNMGDYVDALTGNEGYDYITIAAGANDWDEPLGVFGDKTQETIYGAIDYCINGLLNKYPNAKIGLISPLPMANSYGSGSQLEKVTEALKKVGGHYSIPVLDQFHYSGLRPWNPMNNLTYFSSDYSPEGDGLHPNELGHEWISYPIQNWLEIL